MELHPARVRAEGELSVGPSHESGRGVTGLPIGSVGTATSETTLLAVIAVGLCVPSR